MSDPFQNLEAKTGHSMPEWFAIVSATGLEKHTEIMNFLKTEHGISHGFANGIALQYRSRDQSTDGDDLVDAQYAGPKAVLRPILDRLLAEVVAFGEDVEVAPKRTGVSLRRRQQFAVIEAPSTKRVQLGIQLREHPTGGRLVGTPGMMCSHRVDVTSVDEIDDELVGWLREAYARN